MKKILTFLLTILVLTSCTKVTNTEYKFIGESEHREAEYAYKGTETTHSVILPYAIWYNAAYATDAIQAIARVIRTDENDVAGALFDLTTSLGVPTSLAEIGMKQSDLDEAAEQATKNPYYNPRPIDQQLIRQLLEYAFTGKRPVKGIEI